MIDRRRELGMYTREDLARGAGVSVRTLGTLERGDRLLGRAVLEKVERALGWRSGSALAVLAGEQPQVVLDRPVPAEVLEAIAELYRAAGRVTRLAARLGVLPDSDQLIGPDSLAPADDRAGRAPQSRCCAGCETTRAARRRKALRSRHWSPAGRV
ncbi:helix-turn-helix domain-containing protein [Nocardia noduli]|uniref:helix-turn-helix domain-containing protein n=1 Tax=Nocardia noduli TaxID=2815722 RepID=UPI001C22F986|nr:helix-turn-helix transcriptional regulator [Nocardia noduli]